VLFFAKIIEKLSTVFKSSIQYSSKSIQYQAKNCLFVTPQLWEYSRRRTLEIVIVDTIYESTLKR